MIQLDDQSYRVFFSLYYRRLWAYLAVISGGSEDDIEELLQQTLEKVVKRIRQFDDENKFWAWLATIAKNCYRDRHRHLNRTRRLKDALSNFLLLFGGKYERDREYEILTLDQAVMFLSEREQYLIRSKYYDGYSHRHIAETMGISEKAVESRLARARSKLRAQLLGCKLN